MNVERFLLKISNTDSIRQLLFSVFAYGIRIRLGEFESHIVIMEDDGDVLLLTIDVINKNDNILIDREKIKSEIILVYNLPYVE